MSSGSRALFCQGLVGGWIGEAVAVMEGFVGEAWPFVPLVWGWGVDEVCREMGGTVSWAGGFGGVGAVGWKRGCRATPAYSSS